MDSFAYLKNTYPKYLKMPVGGKKARNGLNHASTVTTIPVTIVDMSRPKELGLMILLAVVSA